MKTFFLTLVLALFSGVLLANEASKSFQLNVGAIRPDMTHEVTLCISG